MEACTKILKHFEQDLLVSPTYDEIFQALDLKQLTEKWLQDLLNTLP